MTATIEIGDITIHRLVESEKGSGHRHAFEFHPNLTPAMLDANRHWMRPEMLDGQDRIVLCFQAFVIRTPGLTVLVDSCIGNEKERPTHPHWNRKRDTQFMDGLAAAGLTVADIDLVLCTHLHVDHVGWNTRLENGSWVPTFPRARYLFSAKELAFWEAQNAVAPIPHLMDSVLPIVAANRAELVTSSHAVSDHIRLLPTPGHTPDHFAVELGRKGAEGVITGDLIHTPLQALYPHLTMRADSDPEQAVATRRAFLQRFCDTATLCCFSHFPSPSVGRIRRQGDGFRCDPG